jgi:hypothetical protein
VVLPAPCSCPECGGKLAKLGEDITETFEVIPRQWKVIQTVREKDSERIRTQRRSPLSGRPIAGKSAMDDEVQCNRHIGHRNTHILRLRGA